MGEYQCLECLATDRADCSHCDICDEVCDEGNLRRDEFGAICVSCWEDHEEECATDARRSAVG